jgi:hypothetical protein
VERDQRLSWDTLIAALGEPAFGGPFTRPDSVTRDEASYTVTALDEHPYDANVPNDCVGWRCTDPGIRRDDYCCAIRAQDATDGWIVWNVCSVHRDRSV